MTNKTDGGVALPQQLSLRDWFAGQAMMGITTGVWIHDTQETDEEIADMAYSQADAMLAAREK